MDKKEKLKMLQQLSEKELTQRFLIPLYESKGLACKNVRYTHRRLEFGKDVVYYKDDEHDKRIYTGVQVKKTKITTKDVATIVRQITEAFGEQFTDLNDGKKIDIYRFVVLTSNEFLGDAKDSLWASLRGSRLDKLVTCVDGGQLVDLLDKHLPSAFWRERDHFNKYFNAMKSEFETIKDVLAIGLKEPVPLEEIYVSLRLVEPEKKEKSPKYKIRKIDNKRRSMKERIFDAEEATKEFEKLVIIGDPGSGKTTLLRHLALKSCKENIEKQEKTCIPVPITLRELSESGKNLRAYIDEVFEKYQFPKAKESIEKDLKDGKCRILFDGFDELATKESQEIIAEKIQKFVEKYRKNQIIVTSRIAGYHDELKGFTKLELMEFDDKQIEHFIENWFGKTDSDRAKSMFNAIKENEQIKALARNPLMIAIIAIIYEEDRKLPQHRAALYNRCVDVLLSKWDMRRRIKNVYQPRIKEFVLKKLAFYAHTNTKRTLSEKEIIKEIRKYLTQVNLKEGDIKPFLNEIWQRNYLLRQISLESYDFLHLSFQEYFTALELRDRDDGISIIIKHLPESWWEEPTLLYAGIGENATTLIERIERETREDIVYSNLLLFGKCVADAELTEPRLREDIANNLWSLYQTAEFASLKEKAINVIAHIKPDNIIDSLIKYLENKKRYVRWRAAEALGKIGSEKAIEPLIRLFNTDKVSAVRVGAAEALGKIGGEKVIEPLIKALTTDKDPNVRWMIAGILGDARSEKAIKPLIRSLATDKDPNVQWKVADALGKIGGEKVIEPLIKALTTRKNIFPWMIADSLGDARSEKAIKPLIKALSINKDSRIRWRAAEALGNIGSEKAIKPLIKALTTDKDSDVRWRAADALGMTGSEKAIEPLIIALTTDKSLYVRKWAVKALGRIGSEKAIEPLIKALHADKDSDVRWGIAQSLGHIGGEKAIESLIKALTTDKKGDVRWMIAYALGNIRSEKATEPLIKALTTDKASDARVGAAEALGMTGSEKAIEPLIRALTTDKSLYVRRGAAEALGNIGSEKAIKPLIKALHADKEGDVRRGAAEALGNIGSEKAIKPLIKALHADKEGDVRRGAAEALGRIGDERAVEPLKNALKDERTHLGVKDSAFISLEKISRRIKKRIIIDLT